VAFKTHPFVNTKGKYGMDLQLNIFAYKQWEYCMSIPMIPAVLL
jgi:hypothetical protein